MAKVTFRELRAGDIGHVAKHLRDADRQEIIAARGAEVDIPAAIARAVLLSSHTWVAVGEDHEPIAIFGVVPLSMLGGMGAPWFLSTARAYEHPRSLVVEGRRYLAEMLRTYPLLKNYVDARNDKSIRWLKRLGFTLREPEPYGPDGMPFHKFEMRTF